MTTQDSTGNHETSHIDGDSTLEYMIIKLLDYPLAELTEKTVHEFEIELLSNPKALEIYVEHLLISMEIKSYFSE